MKIEKVDHFFTWYEKIMRIPKLRYQLLFSNNVIGKKVLGDALEIVTFPDQKHGWTTRGDMSDPKVERDVQKALNLTLAFFTKYMK